MKPIKTTVSAVAMSLMVLGGVSVIEVSMGEGAAFAKSDKGEKASRRKALNAGHASDRAKERANANSRVAKVAAYEAAREAQIAVEVFENANGQFVIDYNAAQADITAYNDAFAACLGDAACEAALDPTDRDLANTWLGDNAALVTEYEGLLANSVTDEELNVLLNNAAAPKNYEGDELEAVKEALNELLGLI